MNCKRTKKLLSPYLDNQLSRREREEFELHIRKCSACRDELKEIEAIDAVLRDMEKVVERSSLWIDISRGIATTSKESVRQREERMWLRKLAPVFSIAFSAGLAILFIITVTERWISKDASSSDAVLPYLTAPSGNGFTISQSQDTFLLDILIVPNQRIK